MSTSHLVQEPNLYRKVEVTKAVKILVLVHLLVGSLVAASVRKCTPCLANPPLELGRHVISRGDFISQIVESHDILKLRVANGDLCLLLKY